MKFSEVFGLNWEQPELDFVDIDLTTDIPLYLDPFAICSRDDHWSRLCSEHIHNFFQTAIDLIRSGQEANAKHILNGLSEPNETHLGLSTGVSQGRGVSGKQAIDLYEALSQSNAAQTGLITELAECDLFIPNVAQDKISDITTNILRGPLVKYTQEQCQLHGIPLRGEVAIGKIWDITNQCWQATYGALPIFEGQIILLVPKHSVRRKPVLESQEYYRHFVLNFLQDEHLARNSSLVKVLKNKKRVVYKNTLMEQHPFDKDFLADFTKEHPEVLDKYKAEKIKQGLLVEDIDEENYDKHTMASVLIERLNEIQQGPADAHKYHNLCMGIFSLLFWPDIIYPQKEAEINEGRKRIDILYTNASNIGFFQRMKSSPVVKADFLHVECKNYSKDPENPEFDQLMARFDNIRGRLGILVFRTTNNPELIKQRCRDIAKAGNGVILPFGDAQLIEMLQMVARGESELINAYLDRLYRSVTM
jgi:hypothetical protein